MEIVLIWLVLSIVAAIAASSRGRSAFGWFLLSLVLSPLITLLLLVALPGRAAPSVAINHQTQVRCPDCREPVRRDAIKCKHCGAALVPQPAPRRLAVTGAISLVVIALVLWQWIKEAGL